VRTDDIVDNLVHSAGQSRGFWIGLRYARSPAHELIKLEVEQLNSHLVPTTDSHLTLAHLGKSCDRRIVEAAVATVIVVSESFEVKAVSAEGLARFWAHAVVLMSPRWLDEVADAVDRCLRDRHVFRDDTYAGVRHVSIGQIKRGGDTVIRMPRITEKYSLLFDTLIVVCGDHVFERRLKMPKPSVF
jgi:2'-5' RNA ligase